MKTLLVMLVLLALSVSTELTDLRYIDGSELRADSRSHLSICDRLRSPHCKCFHSDIGIWNEINCKHPETGFEIFLELLRKDDIFVEVTSFESAVIKCKVSLDSIYSNGSTDTRGLSMISGLQIGVLNELKLYACPFIDSSLEELMTNIGVTDLKHLSINSYSFKNKLKSKHFQHLYHVEKLTLNNNGITSLPSDIFEDMKNLVYLELQHNYLLHLPQGIFNSTRKLEGIDLKEKNLSSLDSGVFKHLHGLRKLQLRGNRLTNLTKTVFSDLINLENLDLDPAGMETVEPDIFANLTKLETLNLFTNPFFSFPKELLSKNTKLEKLKIFGNEEYITLHENKTSINLPSGFLANLFHLKVVRLSGLRIKYLPEDIFNCSINIKKILLTNNLLITLPKNIFIGLKELKYLDLSQNKIAYLPQDLFKDNTKLKTLNINHNILKYIQCGLLASLKLKYVDLSHNELWDVCDSFDRCPDLKAVDLSHNRLTSLFRPDNNFLDSIERYSALKECSQLQVLKLANNSLTEIYDDWHYFKHLVIMNLSYNNFQSVSVNGLNFHDHFIIDLSNNNISRVSLWDSNLPVDFMAFVKTKITRIRQFSVNLDNNPFNCNCHLHPLVQFLQAYLEYLSPSSDLFKPDIRDSILEAISIPSDNLQCHEPKTLVNEKLTSLDQNLLICELNSSQPFDEVPYACPDNCSCHYRAVDRTNVFNCTNTPLSLPLVNKANHSELILTRSRLTKFHLPEGNGYENLRRLDLSHNNLTEFSIPGISTIKVPPRLC